MKKKTIITIVILILLLAYPTWKMHKAKSRVNQFSQQISFGMPIETAESLARKFDLKIIRSGKEDQKPSKLVAWDGWAFARWTCSISYERGKVLNKEILFLD